MYYPSRYEEHNDSLKKFVDSFNQAEFKTIEAVMKEEDFKNDAWIDLWGVKINFDWQKAFLWSGSTFLFPQFQGFERKFDPEKKIHLFIECSKDEVSFVVAWLKDFGDPEKIVRSQEKGIENGFCRKTKHFRIFKYSDMKFFKFWLLNTYPLLIGKLNIK